MIIAKIIRPIWSTQKVSGLTGVRLLEAEIVALAGSGSGKRVVVSDNLGAGTGELVFVTMGSAERDVVFSETAPFKLVVTAIVDQVYLEEAIVNKAENFSLHRQETVL